MFVYLHYHLFQKTASGFIDFFIFSFVIIDFIYFFVYIYCTKMFNKRGLNL